MCTAALCLFKGGESVGSFARLTDDDNQGVLIHNRVAITKFRRQINLNGNTEKFLKNIFGNNTCVICRTAGGNNYFVYVFKHFVGKGHTLEKYLAVFNSGFKGFCDNIGLFLDFLHHKVVVTTLFGGINAPTYITYITVNFFPVGSEKFNLVFSDNGDFTVFDIKNIFGVGN